MTTAPAIANAPDLSTDDYIVIGVATCFIREEGEVKEIQVIEPIPSAALETLFKGIPTSYTQAIATTLGTVLNGDQIQLPSEFPTEAQICSEFRDRALATARTYQDRPGSTELIPVGTLYQSFNFSTDRKRVLNAEHVVTKDDNVKQHAYTHQVL